MSNGDYISELGPLALASRLRRLFRRLHADGERVYQTLNIDFKTKWFPVIHLLSNRSPLALTEVSRLMCVSHPSMIETVDQLVSAGLIQARQSDLDGRMRELSLTDKGRQLSHELHPVWEAFRIAGEEINRAGRNDFLRSLGRLERALDKLSMYDRILTQLKAEKTGRTVSRVKLPKDI